MTSAVKRNLTIGGGLVLIVVALAVGLIRPSGKASATTTPPPPVIEIVKAEQRDVPIFGEWIGTLDGLVNADVRAQVTGYLQQQGCKEGAFARKGQLPVPNRSLALSGGSRSGPRAT
jgi:membrane fusion protein (multidrug efflux system)